MDKPKGYDELKVGTRSDNQMLPITAYVCKILSAQDGVTMGGNKIFDVMFDIAEGDWTNHFAKKYQKDKELKAEGKIPNEPKWSGKLRVFQPMPSDFDSKDPERQKRYKRNSQVIKGFFTSVEQSNTGFKYNFSDTKYETLKGKFLGVVFNEDEYQGHKYAKAVMSVSSDLARKYQEGVYSLPILKKKPKEDEGKKFAEAYALSQEKKITVTDEDLPF